MSTKFKVPDEDIVHICLHESPITMQDLADRLGLEIETMRQRCGRLLRSKRIKRRYEDMSVERDDGQMQVMKVGLYYV